MGDLLLQTIGVTIRIETVLEKDLWPVMIDPTQLELVHPEPGDQQPRCDAARRHG